MDEDHEDKLSIYFKTEEMYRVHKKNFERPKVKKQVVEIVRLHEVPISIISNRDQRLWSSRTA